MKLSDELKAAIKDLPEKEKDKLLFRLIPKNMLLVHQLEYKLLEDSETMVVRRNEVREKIMEVLSGYPQNYYSPGYLMMTMRELSGIINLHVAITKDKHGEISLNLEMLNGVLEKNETNLAKTSYHERIKFDDYVVKRGLKLLKLVASMDEDYQFDFKEAFNKLGKLIGKQPPLMQRAIYNGLDVNHLIFFTFNQ